MALTPDKLTQERYRGLGYHVIKVEMWGLYPEPHRADFLGIYDYLAFNDDGEMIAIQTTTKPNVSTRRKKMLSAKTFSWWTKAGRRSVLHGWYKEKGRWKLYEEELTLRQWEDFQAVAKKEQSTINKNSPLFKELFPNGLDN